MVLPRGWVCPLLKGRDAPDSRMRLCLPGRAEQLPAGKFSIFCACNLLLNFV